ncbi:helix-turn-helix domain-containing protein [Alkalihalobacillus hwajinpoensis]|uniref:helix-turn-helix domain-containing protein n=1 Tax=Guptibacillus hwajinpoensis TaxID=208199 RepID=UPI001883A243|nr:helix-turn-helix domain-containing protein [Pseudalkalibacillus hwajinpoensis]MBF0709047.1 helix-turn-helix domain-containing protein [Pseudalkalibacillus hwajinpoensis]
MQYLDGVLLYIFDRFRGERSLSAVFHLLTGKKSSQTIQDAKLFNVSNFFGVLKQIKRSQLVDHSAKLQKVKLIELNQHDGFKVTLKGKEKLGAFLVDNPIPTYLEGWKYHSISDLFWQRLSLYVQTLSYSIHGNMNFYPISKEENIQNWVRLHFPSVKEQRAILAYDLYKEISAILLHLPSHHAALFVNRLSGKGRTGLTFAQMSTSNKISVEEATVQFQNVIHAFLTYIQNTPLQFPILGTVAKGYEGEWPLTSSTRQTYTILQSGVSLEQIAQRRRLKRSTIEDHLVEIAINVPGFSIDPFVSQDAQREIRLASEKLNSQRLKTIKQYLDDNYSYFEIRLTLCKEGI